MKLKQKTLVIVFILAILISFPSLAATPNLASESAILVEVSTGRILYEKNSTEVMYPASTTKIMTAIIVIENCNLSDIATVSESALSNIPQGYVTCDLQVGEEISIKDLLYALMIPSANDAAYVLAEHVGGNVDNFADMMNAKARELGCQNTHFVNPNGIHDSRHYSTAYDLYLIANYAMKNDTFREICKTAEYTLPVTNKYSQEDRVLKTTNDLLNTEKSNYYKTAIGIKTGHTSSAGYCLVSESARDGLDFISVTLKSDSDTKRFQDAVKLFDYGYDNYIITKIIEKNTVVQSIEVENATKETKVLDLIIDESITSLHNKSINMNDVIPEITLKDEILAPISAGDEIGTIKYKVDDIEYSAKLLAKTDVEKPNYTYYILIIIGIVLFLFASALMKKTSRKNKKRKTRKKY